MESQVFTGMFLQLPEWPPLEAFKMLGLPFALYCLAGCICRIDIMTPRTTALRWRYLYVTLAALVGWVVVDINRGEASWRDVTYLACLATYLHATRGRWPNRVPEVAQKGGLK